MTYIEQIEAYVAQCPATATARLPAGTGIDHLPRYPAVTVVQWDEDFCELEDAGGTDLARFKLVG
jgi:hypothetical protein